MALGGESFHNSSPVYFWCFSRCLFIYKDEIGLGLFFSGACSTSAVLMFRIINLFQSLFGSLRVTGFPLWCACLALSLLPFLSLSPSGPLLLLHHHLTHSYFFPLPPPPLCYILPFCLYVNFSVFICLHLLWCFHLDLMWNWTFILWHSSAPFLHWWYLSNAAEAKFQETIPCPSSFLRISLFSHHKGFPHFSSKKQMKKLPTIHQLSFPPSLALTCLSPQFIIPEIWHM